MLALQTCFEVCQTRHPRNLWKCDWRSLFLEPGNLKSVIVSRYTWNNNRTLAKSRKIKSLHRILWHCTKKFSIIDFFSKCDQICRKLQIWSHFLKKPLMGNFIFFFAVRDLLDEDKNIFWTTEVNLETLKKLFPWVRVNYL